MAKVSIKYIIYNKYRQTDGRYPIKLRFTYNRVPALVPTNLYAAEGELERVRKGEENKSRTIRDGNLRRRVEDLIRVYEEAAENFDPFMFPSWNVSDVIKYLNKAIQRDNFRLDFPSFCDAFVDEKRKLSKSAKAPNNYIFAKNALCSFMQREHFDISELTSALLRDFEAYLVMQYGKEARAVSLYASGIRTMHYAAQKKYNSEELEKLPIKNPYAYYTVPQQVQSKHRAVEIDVVQGMINNYQDLEGRERTAIGAYLLSFATMGMNIPDLYACDYYKGMIHYCRQKTRERRKDDAEMIVKVPDCIKPLLDEYSDKNKPRKFFFNFHNRYSSYSNMEDAAEKGIREYRERVLDSDQLTFYSARHTWATIARSARCKVAAPLIDECLNHVSHTPLVDVYAQKDYSIYWEVNDKVMATLDWTALGKTPR